MQLKSLSLTPSSVTRPQAQAAPAKTAAANAEPQDQAVLGQVANPLAGEPYQPDFLPAEKPAAKPEFDYYGSPVSLPEWIKPRPEYAGNHYGNPTFDSKSGLLSFDLSAPGFPTSADIIAHESAHSTWLPNPLAGEPYQPDRIPGELPSEKYLFAGYQ